MKRRKDYLAVIVILLMLITTISGICSINFTKAYDYVNQYGQTVSVYGYGIYAHDTFFKAPLSIGTDLCILLLMVPLFIYSYYCYVKKGDAVSELKLISVYGVAVYYSASLAFGVTYNRLFLVYTALFACSLFGMFMHIAKLSWKKSIQATRGLKIFLILSGIALLVAWFPDIIPSLINGGTLSLIGVYTTEITYVLDMGIISPLCFVCIYLLVKKNPFGTLILAIMLKACIIVGAMMITQTACQVASGVNLPLPALLTKSGSFLMLGGFALYFNRKMYGELTHE